MHLNAEIALGTVTDVDEAMDWLETTFYYVRAQRASGYAEDHRERVSAALEWLVERSFVEMDDLSVEPSPLGRLASKFYLRLETARHFADLADRDELDTLAVLRTVASTTEFQSVSARSDEEDAVDAVLGQTATDMDAGPRKVLAILRAGMDGNMPGALKSDAWVIRQNALRLFAALRAIVDRFGTPEQANLVSRVEARVDHGVSADAVGLTAIEGVGAGRAKTLAAAGFRTPGAVVDAGVDRLSAAGLSESVAERVLDSARDLPAVAVDWGEFPETIERGERTLQEVTVRTDAGNARAGLRVTVNGTEMTRKDSYLGETTLPVAIFGGDESDLDFTVHVAFPSLPLAPVERSRTIRVTD